MIPLLTQQRRGRPSCHCRIRASLALREQARTAHAVQHLPLSSGNGCVWPTMQQAVGPGRVSISARALILRARCSAESSGTSDAFPVSCRVSSTDSGHLTPFEAGFSLSSGSDPMKDVILRLEAESNEETRVRLLLDGGRTLLAELLAPRARAAHRTGLTSAVGGDSGH